MSIFDDMEPIIHRSIEIGDTPTTDQYGNKVGNCGHADRRIHTKYETEWNIWNINISVYYL